MEEFTHTSPGSYRPLPIHAAQHQHQHQQTVSSLPAKGTCWYCSQPVDNVRRFCNVHCRNDYLEEEVISALAGR